MARLLIQPGTPDARVIDLPDGSHTFGRSEDNSFIVEDDSISGTHCEIIVTAGEARLVDYGSTNGTYVSGVRVQEQTLKPGDLIQLGGVEILFEPDEVAVSASRKPPASSPVIPMPPPPTFTPVAQPSPPKQPALASPPAAGHPNCKYHPRSPAQYWCPKCALGYCYLCVSTRPTGQAVGTHCRKCGAVCERLSVHVPLPEKDEKSFFAQVPGAFKFPINGDGLILLTVGTLLYTAMNFAAMLASYAGLLGLLAILILFVYGGGYLASYLRRIIVTSAYGEDNMPDWPDFSDWWSDIASPFLQLLGVIIACFGPAIIVTIAAADRPALGYAIMPVVALGVFVFPMAFLAVAMFDRLAALNPLLIIPSIIKIPLEYLVACLALVIVVVARWIILTGLGFVMTVPILPNVIAGFVGLYVLTVEMRILGIMYYTNRRKLGWFE